MPNTATKRPDVYDSIRNLDEDLERKSDSHDDHMLDSAQSEGPADRKNQDKQENFSTSLLFKQPKFILDDFQEERSYLRMKKQMQKDGNLFGVPKSSTQISNINHQIESQSLDNFGQ